VSRSPALRSFLITVDGSDESEAALDIAVELAHGVNAAVTLLTVAPVAVGSVAEVPLHPDLIASDQRELDRLAQERLDALAARVGSGLDVTTTLSWEPAGPAIVEQAQRGHHDLIVMPSHGTGALGHLVHDHTARHVLNRASVPVLVVP
jgi:nucleotide-binding universal stress UspA family protein